MEADIWGFRAHCNPNRPKSPTISQYCRQSSRTIQPPVLLPPSCYDLQLYITQDAKIDLFQCFQSHQCQKTKIECPTMGRGSQPTDENVLDVDSKNNINIRNRMKRSSSSSAKQNAIRNAVNKVSAKKHTNNQHFTSFNSTNSLLNEHSSKFAETQNPLFEQFYRTFGSNNLGEWSRPESKQAYRKLCGRPETSKGIRPMEKAAKKWARDSKDVGFHSQYIPEKAADEVREEFSSQIEIIVTKSQKKVKGEKPTRSKFETDLDDQFLQLFAN